MKVNVKDKEKVQEVLDYAQRRSKKRTVTVRNIDLMIADLEENLAVMLPKALWKGLRFRLNYNAQKFPNAYKWMPEATIVYLERFASGWFVTNAQRSYCENSKVILLNEFSETQKEKILERMRKF
jgi:hypothetical protein